jgi:hypothetical protein
VTLEQLRFIVNMRRLIPVESDNSLARDPASNAILATDRSKLQQYQRQHHILEAKEDKINILNDRITALENLINTLINKNEKSQGI